MKKICKKCGRGYYGNTTSKYCSIKCGRRKIYYKDREKMIEKTRKWRKENPEKQKEADHRYYLKNKETYIERAREWDKKYPRKAKERSKKSFTKFRTEKREQFNQLIMNNYYNHKEKWVERGYVYNHRKELLELLPKKCACCGKRPIKIISHLTYNVPKRKIHPKQEEVKKYLIEYAKLLLPFCSKKCLIKWRKNDI